MKSSTTVPWRSVSWSGMLLATVVVSATTPGGAHAEALAGPSTPSAAFVEQVVATTADILDLATYRIHTSFARPDGSTIDHVTPAIVAVPALVDVNGGLPDLAVLVLPLLDRVRLSVTKLPTAAPNLPVRVEAVFDLPAGDAGPELGVAFGYDQGESSAPRAFTADLLFFIFNPPRDTFTLHVSPRGAPRSLRIIGELFTRSGSARLDPKRGTLTVDPVPRELSFTTELISVEVPADGLPEDAPEVATCDPGADPPETVPPGGVSDRANVSVVTSEPVHAVVTASDSRGSFSREVVADIRDLPAEATVNYTNQTLVESETEQRKKQVVDYAANARLADLVVAVDEVLDGAPQTSVDATLKNLPRSFCVDLASDDGPDKSGNPVASRLLEYRGSEVVDQVTFVADRFAEGLLDQQIAANTGGVPTAFTLLHEQRPDDPATEEDEETLHLDFASADGVLGSLEAGVANGRPVVFPSDDEVLALFGAGEVDPGQVPGYAFVEGGDIVARLTDLSSALVETGDPLTVHAASRPAPFVARVDKNGVSATVNVLDLPSEATITHSPTTQEITYSGLEAIAELRAVVDSQTPLVGRATHAEVRAFGLPHDLVLTIDPGSDDPAPDGVPLTLASFDAHGAQLALLEALFTTGPEERLPDDVDGVLLRDLPDRFVLFGRIAGLRNVSVTKVDTVGDPLALRIQSFATTVSIDAPAGEAPRELVADVGRTVASGSDTRVERLVLSIPDRPDKVRDLTLHSERVALPVINPDLVSFSRGQRLRYDADRAASELIVCQRSSATLPEFDCSELAQQVVDAGDAQSVEDLEVLDQLGLTAKLAPLPASVNLCLATDEGDFGREGLFPAVGCFALPSDIDQAALCDQFNLDCLEDRFLVKTAAEFDASERLEINLFDCKELAPGGIPGLPRCIGGGSVFTSVSNLQIQTLRAQIDSPKGLPGDNGYAFLDTDDRVVSGTVVLHPELDDPGDTEVQIRLPKVAAEDGFKAADRFLAFESQVTGTDGSIDVFGSSIRGSCQRPPGSSIEARAVIEVLGADIVTPGFELANDLCSLSRAAVAHGK